MPIFHIPIGPLCCASGLIPTAGGACCSPANVTTTGQCCSGPVNAADRSECPKSTEIITACAAGYAKMADGTCCNKRYRQPRRTRMHRRCATVRARRDPRPARRLRPIAASRRSPPPAIKAPACPPGETRTRARRKCEPNAPPAWALRACAPSAADVPARDDARRQRNRAAAACPPGESERVRKATALPAAPPDVRPREMRTRNGHGASADRAAATCARLVSRAISRGVCAPRAAVRMSAGPIRNRWGLCIPFQGISPDLFRRRDQASSARRSGPGSWLPEDKGLVLGTPRP